MSTTTFFAELSFSFQISGLTMSTQEDNLAITYLAFVQALAVILINFGFAKTLANSLWQYGTEFINDSLKRKERPEFESLLICGGLSKNQIFIETHADACDLPVLCPNEKETVLVGAAMLGACAAKYYPNLEVCEKRNTIFVQSFQ